VEEFKEIKKKVRAPKKQAPPKKEEPKQPKYVDYMAKKAEALARATGDDGFEEVKTKRKNDYIESEDSLEDFRCPSSLGITISAKEKSVKAAILEALDKFPEEENGAILKDNLDILRPLMQPESKIKSQSGWDRVSDLQLTCLQVDRDQYVFDESEIAADFKEKKPVEIRCPAIIVVPNKIVMAVAFVKGQQVEEKIPHIALAKNDWKKADDIGRFVRSACNKGGPFSSLYRNLEKGSNASEDKKFYSGNVTFGMQRQSVTAYMLVLDEPLVLKGSTHIFP